MKTLDLDVLSMVVAVADAGSFVRGAALVHRSRSNRPECEFLAEQILAELRIRAT